MMVEGFYHNLGRGWLVVRTKENDTRSKMTVDRKLQGSETVLPESFQRGRRLDHWFQSENCDI